MQNKYTQEMVARRIADRPQQPDFMTEILQRRDPGITPDEELAVHASTMMYV
jgi:cytochrome P450